MSQNLTQFSTDQTDVLYQAKLIEMRRIVAEIKKQINALRDSTLDVGMYPASAYTFNVHTCYTYDKSGIETARILVQLNVHQFITDQKFQIGF